ncbi:DUF4159 domain-containing protein [Opitutia bacterium ISCC 51]|nr:DUF4159 domain-containing protein [Opitutae bacterium ISCC 51]QXD28956.1 DUF4159 domain-containing protein [Opitutae bacterium ISCC 52]
MSKRIFDTAKQLAGSKQAWVAAVCLSVLVTLPFLHGQRGGRGGYGNSQVGIPTWEVDPEFKNDVFTFARVQYSSYGGRGGWGRGGGRRGGGGWATDYPDAELNLAYRLQQMTSMKVSPEPVVVTLDQEDLQDYPFLYIVEAGRLSFQENEVTALKDYLLNGGFVMFDDFWGEAEWSNVLYEIQRVFPDRQLIDLPIEHPIFHTVFDLKEKPQVPSINSAVYNRGSGITWEREDAKTVHYRGIFDDKNRLMVLICQNTDLGDGWEREGESEWYFREFAEKKAYPMGINIIFYVMTH